MRGRQKAYHHEPTNKQMKRGVQGLADTMPKKGHLTNQERKAGDKQSVIGVLVHIIKEKIDKNGWVVEVGTGKDKTKYNCVNGQGGLYIPDSTITDTMYIPKNKTEAYIEIDKKSKIYTLTKIIGDVIPLASYEDVLTISTNTNEKTNQDVNASVILTKDIINLKASSIVIQDGDGTEVDLLKQNQEIQELKASNKALQDDNETLKEQNESLLSKIEIIEDSIKAMSEEDDSTDDNTDDTDDNTDDNNNDTGSE